MSTGKMRFTIPDLDELVDLGSPLGASETAPQPTTMKNAIDELKELATYLEGMADNEPVSKKQDRLKRAAKWLSQASHRVCGEGYFGCKGGKNCDSDHK